MDDKKKLIEFSERINALEQENEHLKRICQHNEHSPICQGESLCADMIESQREMICWFLPDGTLTYVNKAYCLFLKRSKDQLIGTNFFDLIPPEAQLQAKANLVAITPENPVNIMIHPVLAPDGEQRWQQWSDCGLFSEEGELTGYQSVGHDITELKKTEDLLLQREAKLQALINDVLNDTDVGLCILNKNHSSVWVNKSLQRYFGCDWKDIVGQNKLDVIRTKFAPLVEDPKMFEHKLIDAYKQGSSLSGFQCRILETEKSAERWLDIRSKPVKSGYYAGGRIEQYTDITRLKRSETAFRESEQRFKDLADLLPEAVFETDIKGTIIYANKAAFKYFGYSQADLEKGYNVSNMIHPDDRQRLKSNIRKLMEGEKLNLNEYTGLRKDGSTFPIWSSSAPVKKKGKPTGLRGFIIDVSEHKEKTAELELLKTAIDQVSDAIEVTDTGGNIRYINPAFEKATGYSAFEIIGKNPKILNSGKQPPETYTNLWKTITSGKKWRGRLINRKKDGRLFTEDVSITPVFDCEDAIANYVAVKRDVTDETRNEEKIRHLQKMEALATLAGGIAHDFNNILAGVMGYTELSLDNVPIGSEVHHNLTETIKGCQRAKKLIDQILRFSRTEDIECKPHKINKIIEDTLSLLRSTLPADIEIIKRIKSTDVVAIGPTQMHQVVMNLCTNAYHAMEATGGQLGVSLSRVEMSLNDVMQQQNLNPGFYAKLSISDTGHGMDVETVRKIFDPYFTTKEKDKGTGLGMSVVHGIVNNCGGAINVHSELGIGTTIDIYFPVATMISASETAAEYVSPHPTGSGERILFVDDEKVIVDIGTKVLQQLGYEVTARTSATEALEAFRTNPHRYDLIITDMTMPNMTGDRLTQKIKTIRPDVPVIVCTGFSTRINETKATALGISAILMKPVTKNDYAKAATKALRN